MQEDTAYDEQSWTETTPLTEEGKASVLRQMIRANILSEVCRFVSVLHSLASPTSGNPNIGESLTKPQGLMYSGTKGVGCAMASCLTEPFRRIQCRSDPHPISISHSYEQGAA